MRRPVNEVLPDTLEYFQYSAARLRPHLWHIHDATRDHPPGEQPDGSFHSPSSTYVIEDEGEVLVIDLGVPTQDTHLRELVERIAGGRSIKATLTHNHFDHTGGLEQFSDCPIYVPARDPVPGAARPIPVSGGDVIHMPHYAFQVLEAPGHTAGSILFYEQARGWLARGMPSVPVMSGSSFFPMRSGSIRRPCAGPCAHSKSPNPFSSSADTAISSSLSRSRAFIPSLPAIRIWDWITFGTCSF